MLGIPGNINDLESIGVDGVMPLPTVLTDGREGWCCQGRACAVADTLVLGNSGAKVAGRLTYIRCH